MKDQTIPLSDGDIVCNEHDLDSCRSSRRVPTAALEQLSQHLVLSSDQNQTGEDDSVKQSAVIETHPSMDIQNPALGNFDKPIRLQPTKFMHQSMPMSNRIRVLKMNHKRTKLQAIHRNNQKQDSQPQCNHDGLTCENCRGSK